jgi:hypothetical protein
MPFSGNAVAQAGGYLGRGVTSNTQQFYAAIYVLEHAADQRHDVVCVQMARITVANRVNCKWACREGMLRRLLLQIWLLVSRMQACGKQVIAETVSFAQTKFASAIAFRTASLRNNTNWPQT